jgi:hypothetical protein
MSPFVTCQAGLANVGKQRARCRYTIRKIDLHRKRGKLQSDVLAYM